MRVRLFRAWASNNSGAYVLLGRFRDASVAEKAAADLNDALAAHDEWSARVPQSKDASPFMAFAEAHGLPMQDRWVPWGDGMRCQVLDRQVLLEGYAADMPSAFVAYVAKHEGHVETELIHAHGAVILRAEVWMVEGWRAERQVESAAALARFEARIGGDAELAASLEGRGQHAPRRAHVIAAEDGEAHVIAAPRDVTRASKALRAAALAEGLLISFQVSEWVDDQGDPAEVIARAVTKECLGVELVDVGSSPDEVRAALTEILGIAPEEVARVLGPSPTARPRRFMQGAARAHCELAIRLLRRHGATVRLRSEGGVIQDA